MGLYPESGIWGISALWGEKLILRSKNRKKNIFLKQSCRHILDSEGWENSRRRHPGRINPKSTEK